MSGHAVRGLATGAVLVLLQSLFWDWSGYYWTEVAPLSMKVTVAAVAVLAFARPADALLLIAGLLPLSYLLTTRIWGAYPVNGTEALVLAFLAGWTLRSWRPAARDELVRTVPRSLRSAGLAFGAVVLASAAVQVAVIQAWRDYPWSFTQVFATFLARDYLAGHVGVRGRGSGNDAGINLRIVENLLRRDGRWLRIDFVDPLHRSRIQIAEGSQHPELCEIPRQVQTPLAAPEKCHARSLGDQLRAPSSRRPSVVGLSVMSLSRWTPWRELDDRGTPPPRAGLQPAVRAEAP